MRKKIALLLIICATLTGLFVLAAAPPIKASAATDTSTSTGCSASNDSFFGLEPWYAYLKVYPDDTASGVTQCSVCFHVLGSQTESDSSCPANGTSDIPLVLLAVVDDLLRIAGVIAVGVVLYASVSFVTSQGEPEQVAKARNTIIAGLIGTAIALVAITLISFLGSSLGG